MSISNVFDKTEYLLLLPPLGQTFIVKHMTTIDHHHFFVFLNSIGANRAQNTIQFRLVSVNGVHLETKILLWLPRFGYIIWRPWSVIHWLMSKLCTARPDKRNSIRYECNADYGNLNTLTGFIVFLAHIVRHGYAKHTGRLWRNDEMRAMLFILILNNWWDICRPCILPLEWCWQKRTLERDADDRPMRSYCLCDEKEIFLLF